MSYKLGIDVGGTNTDAVLIDDQNRILSQIKTPTSEDVMTGINKAVVSVLDQVDIRRDEIGHAMLGTTHSTNAIVTRKNLLKTGVIRIGKPATMCIEPMIDWPVELLEAASCGTYMITGGHEFDGREIFPLDEEEIRQACADMKGKAEAVAITSVFSPVSSAHEDRALAIVKETLGDIPVTVSNEIASIGILERENATILNASLNKVARVMAEGFQKALKEAAVTDAAVYICQNDGTLMNIDYAVEYPILTIACGPTNSIRGASFLSGKEDAIVLDVGGTTSDIGVIKGGFPRESSLAVEIGGARTNFRMPDLNSIGLGGGTIIHQTENDFTIGPESVGYQITDKSLVFGGKILTATDIIVRLGMAEIGDSSLVASIDKEFAQAVFDRMMETVSNGIDRMKLSKDPVPVVLVGGGSVLIGDKIDGVTELIRPESFGVANALGAAISQVSGQIERVYSLDQIPRDEAMEDAKKIATEEAVKAGADESTISIVEVDDVPLAYLPGNATRIRVKAVGFLKQ
ncbi:MULTISPECIES: hydantoinase/oxoprolinase N-terminal domain-containing protein [unclassified Oceanispirochaeta]|uniref:hydantoinase/oxoprolinase N-terminal domain-containing protein n=1 Tax=unclassified Oceanispirochaeta TaxID=2635722 RepID=UPI000E095F6B|nr:MULTISPECIES: hydantoinase/oxoprolinase family protein [unclassified Oceanispirochaeta]MBF9016587.1 hydantoinase/oxoprolinase family protein [Oceanispirochaeta sp. M2]NPD73050.1 hydantoinase/oxoprolinase family protein [Oceanispirochaeta sp. M1]RDG31395.1 hydantoinase/oxoprolinase family protein [Oceanispirochaeta sp. M1]